jgi:hypothetical protein
VTVHCTVAVCCAGIQAYENQLFVVSALMPFSVLIITQILAWDILKYET